LTTAGCNILAGKSFTNDRTGEEVNIPAKAWVTFDSIEASEEALSKCEGSIDIDG